MKTAKAPEPLKSEEREMQEAMTYMVDLMSRMYKNQVLLSLNKGSVDKFADGAATVLVNRTFKYVGGHKERIAYDLEYDKEGNAHPVNEHVVTEPVHAFKDELIRIDPTQIMDGDRLQFKDAQTGNYARVLLDLSNKVERSLTGRFSNKRIEQLVRKVFESNDKRARKLFYQSIGGAMGLDPAGLLKRDGMKYNINALVLETTQWAKKLRDETLEMYTANTLRAMTNGDSIDSIIDQFGVMAGKRRDHARFTARNQVGNFNSIMNKTRAKKLGIEKAVWLTSNDERVRPSHQARQGKEFDLSEGLYSSVDGKYLLPGTDYRCRCGYRMVIPD